MFFCRVARGCGAISGSDKQRRYRAGVLAERFASFWLQLKGYRVLERRYKTSVGEIDLIVRRGAVIGFVEVKYRQNIELAAFSVSDAQKRRINKAAQFWLVQHSQVSYETLRFDVVLMAPYKLPVHLKSAFDEM